MTANKASGRERGERDHAHRTTWIHAGGLLGEGIGLVFTDRGGGVSPSPYDTLNLAMHTGDHASNVLANRTLVSRELHIPLQEFVFLEQVHGVNVTRAGRGIAREGERGCTADLPATDGVFTTDKGVVLTVLTADCVPVAIAVPSAGVVAMVHAGWRGTIGNIAALALEAMRHELGIDAADARVVLGPAIASCCYEVDEGRASLFVERYGRHSAVVTGAEGRHIDLFGANVLNLLEAGVREEYIRREGGCTCCGERYFSYRRDGVTGRQGAFIFLRG